MCAIPTDEARRHESQIRETCSEDVLRISRREAADFERRSRARLAGLYSLGIPRNEMVCERVEELANLIARWRVEVSDVLSSYDSR